MPETATTIPAELRTTVTRLRCEHSHPCQPPHGSVWAPGPCSNCGMPWGAQIEIPEPLREPLAALLEAEATIIDLLPAPRLLGAPKQVLAVARAVNGTSPLPLGEEQP